MIWQRIETDHWEKVCRDLLAEHVRETQSRYAERILADWPLERDRFWQIVPKEMLGRLDAPLTLAEAEGRRA